MWSLFPFFQQYPRHLFLDLNAFYTSVEQQECPQYRGKPTIVVPMLADTTCAIASSYEAKKLGIKTGMAVKLAKMVTPALQVVEARPELYLAYHRRLVDALNDFFASVKVLSVDEMACRVPYALYKTEQDESRLARLVKERLARDLGEHLTASVGIAPNVFLSKVAAETKKPDGLTIWNDGNLPGALFEVRLRDLPGIGPAMQRRLREAGIETVEGLWEAEPLTLRRIWGSVLGERWWHMLRGSHECDYQPAQASAVRKSVGHSNVLAPEHRTREGATRVLMELFAKALKRLRAYGQAASAVQVTVRFRRGRGMSVAGLPFTTEGVWVRRSRKHLHANDDTTWLKTLRPILEAIPDLSPTAEPCYVGIVFSELLAVQDLNLSLFDEEDDQRRLAKVLDAMNRKFGAGAVTIGVHGERQVPLRIPFGVPDTPPGQSGYEQDAGI